MTLRSRPRDPGRPARGPRRSGRVAALLASLAALVLSALAGGCGDAPDSRLAEGYELVSAGRVDEAIALANAVLAENPRSASARNIMGLALYKAGDVEGSVDQYRMALELQPEFPEAHFNLGNSLVLLQREAEAEEHFATAVRLEKKWEQRRNVVVARYNLGKRYQATGRTEQALAEYRKCVERDDQFYPAWLDIGKILYDSGDFEGAIPAFERYLELDPVRKEMRVYLGNAYLQSTRPDAVAQAESQFRAAVGIDSTYVDAVYSLGTVLALQGRDDEAEEWFARTYRLTEDDPDTQIGRTVRAWYREFQRTPPAPEEEGDSG